MARVARFVKVGSGLALLSGLVACELVTDLRASDYRIEQSGATCSSVGTAKGQLTSGNATCDSCLAVQCCSAAASCLAGGAEGGASDCATIESCMSACAVGDAGSGECRAECLADLGGLEDAVGLASCATSNCAAAGCTGF